MFGMRNDQHHSNKLSQIPPVRIRGAFLRFRRINQSPCIFAELLSQRHFITLKVPKEPFPPRYRFLRANYAPISGQLATVAACIADLFPCRDPCCEQSSASKKLGYFLELTRGICIHARSTSRQIQHAEISEGRSPAYQATEWGESEKIFRSFSEFLPHVFQVQTLCL